MTGKPSFWERLVVGTGNFPGSERERKVLDYLVYRIREGANLHEVLQEDYVRRNCTQDEVHGLIDGGPQLAHAARERLERAFESGELDTRPRA
jgi:hypothetical protein